VKTAIAYTRVSTAEQGRSGLGLEAQRAAIAAFAEREGIAVQAWHADVQSGKRVSDTLTERPGLSAALAASQAAGVLSWYRNWTACPGMCTSSRG